VTDLVLPLSMWSCFLLPASRSRVKGPISDARSLEAEGL